MALTNQWDIEIASRLSGQVGLAGVSASVNQRAANALALATDALYTAKEEITGTENDIDLSGSIKDPLNNTVAFAKVMGIWIRNNSDADMIIGNVANAFTLFANAVPLAAGAYFTYIDPAGITIGAGSSDILRISGTAGKEYELVIAGLAV